MDLKKILKQELVNPKSAFKNQSYSINTSTSSNPYGLSSVLRTQPAFIGKLYKILEDDSQDLLCWSENGEYFSVTNTVAFSKEILPKYFKHNNWQSFVRQLNMYGFNKINEMVYTNLMNDSSSQTWDFKHPHFKRGDFKSLAHIKRKTTKPTNVSTSNTNTNTTNIINNDDDNQNNNNNSNTNTDTNLNAHVNELSNQISSVVSKVSTLTNEIQTVKTLVQKQHDVIQDLIDIVCSKEQQQQQQQITPNAKLPYIFPQTSQQTRLDDLKQPSPVSLENLKQSGIKSLEVPFPQQLTYKGIKRRLSIPIGVGTSNTSNITPSLNPLADDEFSNGNKNENASISSLSTEHSSNQRKRRSSIPIGVGTSSTSNITPLLNPMTDEEYIHASRQTHFRSTSPPNQHHHHNHHFHHYASPSKYQK